MIAKGFSMPSQMPIPEGALPRLCSGGTAKDLTVILRLDPTRDVRSRFPGRDSSRGPIVATSSQEGIVDHYQRFRYAAQRCLLATVAFAVIFAFAEIKTMQAWNMWASHFTAQPLGRLRSAEAVGHAQAAKSPCCAEIRCGTNVHFVASPAAAMLLGRDQAKLVFLLHVSGNFEDPALT
jgi:hypothetical protein